MKREELAQIGGAIVGKPLLMHTAVQGGIEFSFVNDIEGDEDVDGIHWAAQLTNSSDYLGYKITTQAGLKVDRTERKRSRAVTVTQSFISIYAGLE